MATITLVTAWGTNPTSASKYEIYKPDDQLIIGNGVDTTKKYDGTDFTELEGGAPKGNILAVYKFRLMVAGDVLFPHRIWFSQIGSAEGWTKSTDWIDIYPNDGGKINGMSIQNDELIISKDNGRKYGWRIYDDGDPQNSKVRVIDDSHGNVTRRAETVMSDIQYFYDHEGMFDVPKSTAGGVTFIVDALPKGVEDKSLIAMGSHRGKVYISMGNVSIDLGDDVTLTNAVLVYDSVNKAFYVLDNVDARVWAKFNDGTEEKMYFGDSSGKVFEMQSGTTAGGNPIHMRVRTKKYLEELGKKISVSQVGIYMDNPDNTLVTYRTSNTGNREVLGQVVQETVQWFPVQNAKGEFLELEFTHSNSYTRPSINGISIIYHLEGEKQTV